MEIQPSLSQPSSNRRQKSSSGDSFSFPSTPNQEEELDFEFESLTPTSPSCTTSPADHIFFNGRLQPHSFPLSHRSLQQQQHYHVVTTSRTSSISSKDSFLSSRSSSTNSSCSSARTSSSDSSERRLFNNSVVLDRHRCRRNRTFGGSKRWQYITPAPSLNRDASKRRREIQQQHIKSMEKKKLEKKKKKTVRGVPLRFGWRIFRWFLMACRQCHAMEPSKAHKQTVVLEVKTCE